MKEEGDNLSLSMAMMLVNLRISHCGAVKLQLFWERPWRSGNVMNCHATAPGSIPGRDGVFTELHVLRKGQ